jgi:cysteinyl-tRNA synthetase
VEQFKPITELKVGIYACGPTVYHYAHIGNMRTYIFQDVLTKSFRHFGYCVQHVMNITDVGHLQSDADSGDDKLMLGAARENKTPFEIARFYEDEFFRHSRMLGIRRPDVVCRATEHISDIISMIERLITKGIAYLSAGNVYFNVEKFPSYHELGRLKLKEQQATDRVAHDPLKCNQSDFALWFSTSKYPNQVMKWESPWGSGFPGWHIECSAMASKILGEHVDIHCGGVDHISVHHSNEIAQSESCFGHRWVNYWFHCEFLNIDAEKMSKSKGEFLTVDTLTARNYDPLAFRYLVLGSHYRSPMMFTWEALDSATTALLKLRNRVLAIQKKGTVSGSTHSQHYDTYLDRFFGHLKNDLHTPSAIAELWSVIKADKLNDAERIDLLSVFDKILGIGLFQNDSIDSSEEYAPLIAARNAARSAKNWTEADRIRDLLLKQGIQVKDTKHD